MPMSSSNRTDARNSVFRDFSLLLRRHNSDLRVKTIGQHKIWLDQLDTHTDVKKRKVAIANMTSSIEKYEKVEIPLIWEKTMALVKRSEDEIEERMLLELLSQCCVHCGNDTSLRLMFYFTLLDLCCDMGDKVTLDEMTFDTCLDIIFVCIEGLTHQGADTAFLEQDETMRLSEFLDLCLLHITKFNVRTCLSFLSLLNNCLRNSSITVNGLDRIIQCAQKTPNPDILLNCLHTMGILINQERGDISDASSKDLVYIITGAINLNNKLNQQLLKTLDALIASKYWKNFWRQLKLLIEDPNTSLLNLRGAVTVLTDLALQDKEDWLIWLTKIYDRGNSMYGQILECIQTLINDESFFQNEHGYIWFNQRNMCLLKILNHILTIEAIRQNNPNTITSIFEALVNAFVSGYYTKYGFENSDDLLSYILAHRSNLQRHQEVKIGQFFSSRESPVRESILIELLGMISTNTEVLRMLTAYFSRTYSQFDKKDQQLQIDVILPFLSSDEDPAIFRSCADFLIAASTSLSTEELLHHIDEYLIPKQPRRKSIVSLAVESGRSKWKSEEQCIAVVRLFQRNLAVYPYMITMWQHGFKFKKANILLILARILMKIRIDSCGRFYLCKEADVDGLTAIFQRNSNIHSIDKTSSGWIYPEDEFVDYIETHLLEHKFENASNPHLLISEWTELLIEYLQKPSDWEVYSYILCHLCPQLGNFNLFADDLRDIDALHIIIMNQLSDGPPIKPQTGINKSDVQLAFVRTCSALFPYYKYLGKSSADGMIEVSLTVLKSSFEKTVVPLLHIFTISCYEIPFSIKKHLNALLETLSIRLTKKLAIPSLLEFLIALSDSPEIISPLTLEQMKRIFAIAFKLIEASKDLKQDADDNVSIRKGINDEQRASLDPSTSEFSITKPMAHFYMTLSYQVISHWFVRISLSKRPLVAPFLLGKLSSLELCYDTEAYKDFVNRFTATDLELRVETVTSDAPHHGERNFSHEYWYYNKKILSVETNNEVGSALVIVRGPSGNSVFQVNPIIKNGPSNVDLFNFGTNPKSVCINRFTPAYIVSQFTGKGTDEPDGEIMPIEDPLLIKSIQVFDTIPVIEFHKVGLLYMTGNDKTEKDILSHTLNDGSYQYKWFINELGSIIAIQENDTFYVGGLSPSMDGDYALIWHDQKCQIVFHATSLMPNNDELDPNRTMKKRHVGNNFVNVYYDEREEESFPFDIVKSQFNFINIVVRPLCKDKTTGGAGSGNISEFYKVKLYRAKEVAGIFSTTHFKIMHKQRLASYIRHVSTFANTFAQSWHGTVTLDHCSTWSRRAAHIESIRTRLTSVEQTIP